MQRSKPAIAMAVTIAVATLAALVGAYRRFHVEEANRRVEIGLEWQEVNQLAQFSGQPAAAILDQFKQQHVSSLVLAEETLVTFEQSGAVHVTRRATDTGAIVTDVEVQSPADLQRIRASLSVHGMLLSPQQSATGAVRTHFHTTASPAAATGGNAEGRQADAAQDYISLRSFGLGLPEDGVAAAKSAGLSIAGRISNYPGITVTSALAALQSLHSQGAEIVIFSGDEVLGYRGLEKQVAEIFRAYGDSMAGKPPVNGQTPGTVPLYGAVEFGKQKGDEKLSAALRGDFVRVHSIQAAEMGQMEEDESVDRFVRAAKERNIRFCYVRLKTFAGEDAVPQDTQFLNKIARGMAQGSVITGGGLSFGRARLMGETGVPTPLFGLIALGAAAGTLWMVRSVVRVGVSDRLQLALLASLAILCFVVAFLLGESGRKLVAFLAGVVYPATACLTVFPYGRSSSRGSGGDGASFAPRPLPPVACLVRALTRLGIASLITGLGIIQVVGLLASRTFMLHANQFLGIKAQHAVPLLIVALVAVCGGVAGAESWDRFRVRAARSLQEAMAEPARFGTLLLGLVALLGLALVVARTGNDAGVGVSGTELKMRAILDRVLPVRPRTKEFLVGHPAFVLALAWWWRGRRRIAVPTFVVGSLGQVSLLNTFCHIHTPMIVSLWRDSLGLLFGVIVGAALFLALEPLFQATARHAGRPAANKTPGTDDA